jgi:hypothetical protein
MSPAELVNVTTVVDVTGVCEVVDSSDDVVDESGGVVVLGGAVVDSGTVGVVVLCTGVELGVEIGVVVVGGSDVVLIAVVELF